MMIVTVHRNRLWLIWLSSYPLPRLLRKKTRNLELQSHHSASTRHHHSNLQRSFVKLCQVTKQGTVLCGSHGVSNMRFLSGWRICVMSAHCPIYVQNPCRQPSPVFTADKPRFEWLWQLNSNKHLCHAEAGGSTLSRAHTSIRAFSTIDQSLRLIIVMDWLLQMIKMISSVNTFTKPSKTLNLYQFLDPFFLHFQKWLGSFMFHPSHLSSVRLGFVGAGLQVGSIAVAAIKFSSAKSGTSAARSASWCAFLRGLLSCGKLSFRDYYDIMDYLYYLLQMSMHKEGTLSVEHGHLRTKGHIWFWRNWESKLSRCLAETGLARHITTDTLHFIARATLHHLVITVFASNLP